MSLYNDLRFRPANLRQTVAVEDAGHPSMTERARSAFRGRHRAIAAPRKSYSFLAGAGSLRTAADDFFRFTRAIVGGRYGVEEQRRFLADGGTSSTGISNGFRTTIQYVTESDLTIVVVTNLQAGSADLLLRDLPRLATGELVALPKSPYPAFRPLSRGSQAAFAGRYRLGGDIESLSFDPDGTARLGDYVLLPMRGDSLFSPQDYTTVVPIRDVDGRVTGLQWGAPPGPFFPREK